MGGKGGGDAPAPDPQIGQAALMNAQTGQQWLSFAKTAYATQTARQKDIDALSKQVTQQALDVATQQQDFASEQRERYKTTFQPLEDQYVEEAKNYDTPERREAAAGQARADVLQAADTQRQASERNLSAMGVKPGSGRFAGIDRATNLGTAVAAAGAEDLARRKTEATGLALQGNAINIGKGFPAQANQAASLGLSAGVNAANVTNAANQQSLSAYPIMASGFQGQMTGFANQADILQNQYNSQLNAWEFQQQQQAANTAGILSGIGGIAGLFLSSKKFKTAKRKSRGHLKAVKKMPVERWRYKTGIADEGEHVGPYAEDFKRATGLGDGRSIPAQDAFGVTMGAVKELAEHVDRLEKKVSGRKASFGIKPDRKAA